MKPLYAILLVMSGVVAAACGGDDSPGTPSGGGGNGEGGQGQGGNGQGGDGQGGMNTTGASCDDFGKAFCAKFSTCAPFLVSYQYGDVATCEKRMALNCTAVNGVPGTVVDADAIKFCLDAVPAASCDAIFGGTLAACTPQAGTLDEGAACGDEAQCKSRYCDNGAMECGKCAPSVAKGESCAGKEGACVPGTFCTAGGKTCEAPGNTGDACDAMNKPCASNLACNSGKCAKPPQEGEACDPATLPCDFLSAGLSCNFTTKKCEKMPVAQAGADCGYNPADMTFTLCGGGSTCIQKDKADASKGSACMAPAEDGKACNPDPSPAEGPDCLTPAKCSEADKLCKAPNPGSCK